MLIQNVDMLAKVVAGMTDEEQVKNVLIQYVNKRVSNAIEESWRRARVVQRFAVKNRKEQLKKHILEMDDYSAFIPLVEFLRYFASLQDYLKEAVVTHKSPEVLDLADEMEGLMFTKLEKIKLDRRSMYQKS